MAIAQSLGPELVVPLIRLVQAWLYRIGINYSHPGWLGVAIFVGLLLFPLVIIVALAALVFEATTWIDRGDVLPSGAHWAFAVAVVLIAVVLFAVIVF